MEDENVTCAPPSKLPPSSLPRAHSWICKSMIKDQQMNCMASDTEQRPINQPSLKSGEGCCFFVVVVCFCFLHILITLWVLGFFSACTLPFHKLSWTWLKHRPPAFITHLWCPAVFLYSAPHRYHLVKLKLSETFPKHSVTICLFEKICYGTPRRWYIFRF